MNLEAERNNLIVLNATEELISLISNNKYNEIDVIKISDFLEKVDSIVDVDLREELGKKADIVKNVFVDNKLNIDYNSLNRAMDALESIRQSIKVIDVKRESNIQAQEVRDSLALREEQYREDYKAKLNEEFLRSLKNKFGERVYSDEDIANITTFAELEELVNSIKNNGLDISTSSFGETDSIPAEDVDSNSHEIDENQKEIKKETEKFEEESKKHEIEVYVDFDDLNQEYKEIENIIIGYIQADISRLRRLELRKERLIEEKNAIAENDPSKKYLDEEYDRQISELDNEIRKVVNPTTEENIKIRTEKDKLYRLATQKIQKLEDLIRKLESRNRKLNFEYSEMVYDGISDYQLWYKKKNEIDENEYKIRQIKDLISKYNNLKEELRKTEKVIDLSKFDVETKKEKKENANGKKIIMTYPDNSLEYINDGRDHEIIPTKLESFILNGEEYYLMTYFDVTYNCECITYLRIIDGKFVKIPMTDYPAFEEIISGLPRTEVDITVLPTYIGLGPVLDVSILIQIINGGGVEEIPVVPPVEPPVEPPIEPPVEPPIEPPVEPPIEPPIEEDITFEEILDKIKGDAEFTAKQASRYSGSKIKVFSKMEKNKWGNTYSLLSIPRRLFGIIPKAFMKARSLFVSRKTKDTFEEMQKRVDNLTDKELEILRSHCRGNIIVGLKNIPLVNNMILGAIQKYIMRQYMVKKNEIADVLLEIEYYAGIAKHAEERLVDISNDDKDYEQWEKIIDDAYLKSADAIRRYRKLNLEANELLSGSGIHALEEEIKAANSKMNYVGGGFTKFTDHDPELSRRLGELAHIIEFSKNPKEVVDAYFENKDLYVDNTVEKRSLLNLGSKVSVGALDYRPLPEVLYYGNNPLIQDLITTILLVSSLVNLYQSIQANIHNNQIIQNHNKDIADNNYVGQQHQLFKEKVQGGKDTIEQGFITDIHRTPGSSNHLAERSVDNAFDWDLRGPSYRAADNAYHSATSQLTNDNIREIADLSQKAQSGIISEVEYINGLEQILQKNHAFSNQYFNTYGQNLRVDFLNNTKYDAAYPSRFDFTSIIKEIDHVVANPSAASDFSKFVAEVFENSHMIPDFHDLSFVQGLVDAPMGAGVAALAAAGFKAAHEEVSKTVISPTSSWEQDSRFNELLEQLKSGRMFTKEELDQSVEDIIARTR